MKNYDNRLQQSSHINNLQKASEFMAKISVGKTNKNKTLDF